jgi:hypothetical protein
MSSKDKSREKDKDKDKKKKSKKGSKRKRDSSDSDSDDSQKRKKKEKEKRKNEETEEERRARRIAKKVKKMASRDAAEKVSGYTNDSNPFGDQNLSAAFVWKKVGTSPRSVPSDGRILTCGLLVGFCCV